MDDRAVLKLQGVRNLPNSTESKLKHNDGMKPSTSFAEARDEGFEVILMRKRNTSNPTKSKAHQPSRIDEGLSKTRSRGRSPPRKIVMTEKRPSFIETESTDSSSSFSTSTVLSAQKNYKQDRNSSIPASSPLNSKASIGTKGSRAHSHSRGRSLSNPRQSIQMSPLAKSPVDDIETLLQSVLQAGRGGALSPKASPRRGRSLSQSRHSRHSSRTRSQSRCRSMGIEEYTFAATIEPNIHDSAIMNMEIKTRDTIEMNENELYARKAGLSL